MSNLHVPTTTGSGGAAERFQELIDEMPGSRFIAQRWCDDPMVVLTVISGEDWQVPADQYTAAFAHAASVESVEMPRFMADVTVLWAPQLAAEMLAHYALDCDHVEVRWAEISPEEFAALRVLDPAEMCRRVLLCTAAFSYTELHEVDVAAAITAAAADAGVDFDTALELVDPEHFDPAAFAAVIAAVGAD